MKKIKRFLLLFLGTVLLAGCLGKMGPAEKVEELLDRYIKNDESIMEELDIYLDKQELTETQKKRYKDIIKNEYANIKYVIDDETIEDDKAVIELTITVKDLYGASEQAENDLLNSPTDFYTEGIYDSSKFIDHKLDIMENYEDTKTYVLYITLTNKDEIWTMDDLDEETLEKIHGIYNYTT